MNNTSVRYFDQQVHELMYDILHNGYKNHNERTGETVTSLFGPQMRFDLRGGHIPLLTTKKMFTKGILIELLWYLKATGDISELKDNNVHIWDQWADEHNNLGPVYGVMWRKWPTITHNLDGSVTIGELDQLQRVIDTLKNDPSDRRMIVTAWNPDLVPDNTKTFSENVANGKQALPPCSYLVYG